MKKRSHHHTHTSVILDSTEGPADARRWSKADINYSEFEVVREPPFPSTSKSKTLTVELMDEDNYNIVQEVRTSTRVPHQHRPESSIAPVNSSRTHPNPSNDPHHTYSELTKKSTDPHPQGNDGYSELGTQSNSFIGIGDHHNHHQYSDLTKRSSSRSPTGYYQEIGDGKSIIKKRDNLYQKIRRKGGVGQGDESDEDEEDEEDQFYEKVKSKPTPAQDDLPNHANPSALKHGYEKINPKTTKDGESGTLAAGSASAVQLNSKPRAGDSPNPLESDEDGSSLYEQVKYPPYERLKESKDNLLQGDEEDGGMDDMYEDIGYSRIKKSTTKASQNPLVSSGGAAAVAGGPSSPVDVDNLYARVDMTKKKRNTLQAALALPKVP